MDQGMSQASIIEMTCIRFVCDMVKYYGSHWHTRTRVRLELLTDRMKHGIFWVIPKT